MDVRKIIIILFIFCGYISNAQEMSVKKIEPPFWWVGMNNSELQLMVYGENIGDAEITIEGKQVSLKKVHQVENKNYVFIDLEIDKDAVAQNVSILLKGDKKVKVNYELRKRENNSNNREGFNNSDVIYLLMPDRFSNGNPNNDNVDGMLEKADRSNPDGRHGGDIQGIINHLDYIDDLGVTALWINPLFENNNEKYSYHGYAITDFYNVDARFGANSDYLQLVQQCHNRDIKVILDMVFNHCGINHWMMKDLPMKNWLNQWPEFTRTNYRASVLTDPYASEYDKNRMDKGWFDTNMPDLNNSNVFVEKYLIQNTIWWIEYSGLDGIRLDTQPYASKEMVAKWGKRIKEEYPNFRIVGEAWLQKEAFTAFFQENQKLFGTYSSNLPSVTDFSLYFAIIKAFNEDDTWTEGIARLYYVLAHDFLYSNANSNVIFIDNHDLNRFYESVNHDFRKFKMGITFLLTTRGIPMLYYGTEFLMKGEEHKGHGFIRKDFPGGWQNDTLNYFTDNNRNNEQNEAFSFVQNLLKWRQTATAVHKGKLTHFIPENGLYVYFRSDENQTVMVIMNNKEEEKTVKLGKYSIELNNKKTGVNVITNESIDISDFVKIAPKSVIVIDIK